ncbi:MAG: MFS transporter [Ferruginibacter sp.]|nr:MFS transporter [Cytophagales bacterium]
MAVIDSTALNVALPALQADLGATGTQLLWVVNAYVLMLAAFILVGGSLGDHLGRKKMMMIGIVLFVLSSAAGGLAPSVGWLIAARTLQGMGGALMIPGSLAIITAAFEAKERGKAIGTWSAASAVMVVIGPILGGFLADAGLWRAIFLLNLPIGLVALGLIAVHVPESRDESVTGGIDYLGALLASLGLAGLAYGFTAWSDAGPGHPAVYGSLAGGLAGLGLFVRLEARRTHPLMPLHLFASRTFSGTNLLTLFLYGALSAGTFFLSLNLVQVQGYSPSLAGLAFMPLPLPLILLSRWSGGIADQFGSRIPLIIGPLVAGAGFLWLSFAGLTTGPGQYWTTFGPGILLFGLGMTLTVVPLTNAVMGAVATHYAGTASGINNAVSRVASVLAIAVIGSLAIATFGTQLEARTESLALSPAARSSLQREAGKLGAASVSADIPAAARPAVRQAIRLAFTDTFRLVMRICTGLAWLSALMAGWLVEARFTALE